LGCKLFTGIFTFHGSGAVKRFVVSKSKFDNQQHISSSLYIWENDWIINKSVYFDILEKQKGLCEGDPEQSMTRNCRVHCIIVIKAMANATGDNKGIRNHK